jgi:PAS domain S-box-containing protein
MTKAVYDSLTNNPSGPSETVSYAQCFEDPGNAELIFHGLLEAAPDGMVLVNHVNDILLLNSHVEEQFGYSRDELVGQKVTTIIPVGFADWLSRRGERSAVKALPQQMSEGIELHGRRKDGTEFPIEILLSPVDTTAGILAAMAIRNASERKAADVHLAEMESEHCLGENALRESEERYRMLLDGIEDYAIYLLDPQGQIISWNAGAERIKGYRADEIIGRNFSCFFPPRGDRARQTGRDPAHGCGIRTARGTMHARAEGRLTIFGECQLYRTAELERKPAWLFRVQP